MSTLKIKFTKKNNFSTEKLLTYKEAMDCDTGQCFRVIQYSSCPYTQGSIIMRTSDSVYPFITLVISDIRDTVGGMWGSSMTNNLQYFSCRRININIEEIKNENKTKS